MSISHYILSVVLSKCQQCIDLGWLAALIPHPPSPILYSILGLFGGIYVQKGFMYSLIIQKLVRTEESLQNDAVSLITIFLVTNPMMLIDTYSLLGLIASAMSFTFQEKVS